MSAMRPNWDEYFMTLAYHAATRSIDESTHAGAVIVRPDNTIVSTGYNGPVRGEDDAPQTRPEKYAHFQHAERNAIYAAAKHGTALAGCRLYVNFMPCADCARAIMQTGIVEIIAHKQGQDLFMQGGGPKGQWSGHDELTARITQGTLRWWNGYVDANGFFRSKEYNMRDTFNVS